MVIMRDRNLLDLPISSFLQALLQQFRERIDAFTRVHQNPVFATADNVAVRALQLERARIQAQNAVHERRKLRVVGKQFEAGW